MNNNNLPALPDLSGWHPLPDDATVPEDMLIAARRRDDGTIEVYPADEWAVNPANRLPSLHDYFTPEPVQSPESSLPTEPGTWIVADILDGQEDMVLVHTENGAWSGITDNGASEWVPVSCITKWREIKWVPADEPDPVQVDVIATMNLLEGHSCVVKSPNGHRCDRSEGHKDDLHISDVGFGSFAVWGEVAR